jgi:hypothetical protein
MLGVPVMKAKGNLDFTRLEKTLRTLNCSSDDTIAQDIKRFDEMRKQMIANQDKHTEETLHSLREYFYQLKSLLPRFHPMENDIQLDFTWEDPFVPGQSCTMITIYFETACVVWNLAAIGSKLAAAATDTGRSQTTDAATRLAGRHYQLAAGYFEYLKEEIIPNLTSSNSYRPCLFKCFTRDYVSVMKSLMLSMGQMSFYEKAVRDRKKELVKPDIVAKLASQAAQLFAQTATRIPAALGKDHHKDAADLSWVAMINFQSKCLRGKAEYWQAWACHEKGAENVKTLGNSANSYGEEILRYKRAERYLQEAIASGRIIKEYKYLPTLIADANNLCDIVVINRIEAENELETLTNETTPKEEEVLEVPGLAMMKAAELPPQVAVIPRVEDLLFRFVFSPEVAGDIRRFMEKVNELVVANNIKNNNNKNIVTNTSSAVETTSNNESSRTTIEAVSTPSSASPGVTSDKENSAIIGNSIGPAVSESPLPPPPVDPKMSPEMMKSPSSPTSSSASAITTSTIDLVLHSNDTVKSISSSSKTTSETINSETATITTTAVVAPSENKEKEVEVNPLLSKLPKELRARLMEMQKINNEEKLKSTIVDTINMFPSVEVHCILDAVEISIKGR